MAVFTNNVMAKENTDLLGIGVTLNADGSVATITGPTIERVTAAPAAVRNAGSLALRSNGTAYITSGGGTWFALGGAGAGWNLPDDVAGIWGTNAPGQVSSTFVSASNRFDLSGDAINQATAASGAAIRIETGTNTITGAVVGNASSNIEIRTGATDCTNAGGTGGASGSITISTGNATSTAGTSGASLGISLVTGNSEDANSGPITLTTGTAGGTRGLLDINIPVIDTVTQTTTWDLIDNSATGLRVRAGSGGLVLLTFDTTDNAETIASTARLTTTDGVTGGTARVMGGLAYRTVANSATITNTMAETAFSTGAYTIPANTLKAGTTIRVRLWGDCPSTNAADTLTITLRLGAAGVAAQVVSQTSAVDVANGDTFVMDVWIVIRTAGGAGTMVASSQWQLGVPDTATFRADTMASSAIDTTMARDLTATATWSAASTADQVILRGMCVDVV